MPASLPQTTSQIREQFLQFFASQGHQIVASSSLVPGNDKTLLFTNAGMVQFKDVFTGDEVRDYQRATTSQRCVRAGGKHNDLDNVGYTARHHTFFEMLGNFSFGDYFKREAIQFAWSFLTGTLGLPADKLWVTIFEEDDEAESIWVNEIGVPAERVIRIGAKDNFWMMGDTGPCGPCSEIFYDHGEDVWGGPPGSPEEDGDRYIEIWNLVFMQFDRSADGTMTPLPSPCVDTGMGLERIAAVLQHVHSNYEIDLFDRLIRDAAKLLGVGDLANPSLRVITDHLRSCAFLIVDGVLPSNEGRGYVLRRIIRRAARHGHKLGASGTFFHKLVPSLVREMGQAYPELVAAQAEVDSQLLKEEERFAATLSAGLSILDDEVANLSGKTIPGEVIFKLYDTYGFPADLTGDIARERELEVDMEGFNTCMEAQRTRARAASNFAAQGLDFQSGSATVFVGYTENQCESVINELFVDGESVERLEPGQAGWVVLSKTPFYGESGGQVGDVGHITRRDANGVEAQDAVFEVLDTQKQRQAFAHAGALSGAALTVGDAVTATIDVARRERIRQNHSATHLLHGALRSVLGTHVEQKGSLVNDESLRFDFSHGEPVTEAQRVSIEQWIDREVRANSECSTQEMSMEDAVAAGAMALFGEKYGDIVRVVRLGDRSVELCGGTHVGATGELGGVKVLTEGGVAAGVRRIEAVSGSAALSYSQALEHQLNEVATTLKAPKHDVVPKLKQLQTRNRDLAREVEQLQAKLAANSGNDLAANAETIGNVSVLLQVVEDADAKSLRTLLDQLRQKLENSIIVLASEKDGKVSLIASVADSRTRVLKAGDLLKEVTVILGGRGGGRADMAQGGADSLEKIEESFAAARALIQSRFSV
ncbi:alanine--tRNA ligase [Granulosicoccus antarcticus]|uniref:Alanine--tRNA ligase n=1 Tax=Granulosicoccus antarcticus IMCC3135 TaxID=1192854 RepID=A0A2Z2NUM7_9GAMM|nr:alanine--tRNA ligase [Granulosicoccus antarcticus]ASJ72470.1 Alanine--tRNA ligase [Granulosicoccus antarcticus IMCC3135]